MNSGLLFLWIAWILFIIVYFFMDKAKKRTFLITWILLIICSSKIYVTVSNINFSFAFFILFFGCFLIYFDVVKQVFHLAIGLTVMVAYASILIWEQEAPIWLLFPRMIFIPCIIVGITYFLCTEHTNRLAVVVIGLCGGELLYALILYSYNLPYIIGAMYFFDTLCVTVLFTTFLNFCMQMKRYLLAKLRGHYPF